MQEVCCYVPSVLHLNCWWNSIQDVSYYVPFGAFELLIWDNSIQDVSSCMPPVLHLNCWYMVIKFHPVCELLYASWAPYELLTCSHEIPSSLWVATCLLGYIADMWVWNCIQDVSYCVFPGLHVNYWNVAIKLHPGCELLCASCT